MHADTNPLNKGNHLHAHRHGDAQHQHYSERNRPSALRWALMLTMGFAGVEAVFGILSNSLALISDAGHMVTDAAALALALLAQHVAKRPPTDRYSFGFGRAESLAAFVNGLALLGVVGWIGWEAVQRLSSPEAVQGKTVMLVASVGLVINVVVAWVLSQDQQSVNTKAALVHVMGDLLGSIAALAAGAVIYFTGKLIADPILSILVCLLILKSNIGVLAQSYHFLMKGVPEQIDYAQVGQDLIDVDGVLSVHDLHIWEMSPDQPALIGHLEIADLQQWPQVLTDVKDMLLKKHGIDHITLQAETPRMAAEE
jgi:cobalt-zinc-cadmium efflux system protein